MPSLSPGRGRKRIGRHEITAADLLEDELGDAVADLHDEIRGRVQIDQVDEYFASVPGVDRSGGVDHGDPVPSRQPRAWVDEAHPPPGEGEGNPGRDECPLPRPQHNPGNGAQIGARVPCLRITRQPGIRMDRLNEDARRPPGERSRRAPTQSVPLRRAAPRSGPGGQAAHSLQTKTPALSDASWLR